MNLRDVQKLQTSFQGTIETLRPARTDVALEAVAPATPLLVPTSNRDVVRALHLARAADRKVFVRSGAGVLGEDPGLVAAGFTAVLSLEAFGGAEVHADLVRAGAATTVGELANAIAHEDVFLPLGDDASRSLISALLDPTQPFPRSAPGASLRSVLARAHVIPVEGVGAGYAKKLELEGVRPFLDGERSGVVTRIELDPTVRAVDESQRWLDVWTAPYEVEGFARLCDRLLGSIEIPAEVDVAIRVTAAAYGLKIVVVRATGRRVADHARADVALQAALSELPMTEVERTSGPGSSAARWLACGSPSPGPDETHDRFGPASGDWSGDHRAALLEAIDFALGVDEDGLELSAGISAWVEIGLREGGATEVIARLVEAGADDAIVAEARARFASAIPTPAPIASPALEALRGVDVLAHRPTVDGFRLELEAPAPAIPGFKGRVLPRGADRRYRSAAQQYASSSYDAATVRSRMTPAFVASPLNAEDVVAAVSFAAQASMRVVARSGGHQYCGLSSGGDQTLVLDMSEMSRIAVSSDGKRVTVGPGLRLRKLSKTLLKHGVVIPHGECPLVALGGHTQTGGVGHQLRTLGLTQDHVVSFKMVVWGSPPLERLYTRPTTPAPAVGAPVTDDDVFRAVLGGGPGSWGVITEITFEVRRDAEFPDSQAFYGAYWYDKSAFAAAMEQLWGWAKSQHAGNLPDGADLFLSVVSGDFPRPPAVLVEAMSTNPGGRALTAAAVAAVDLVRAPLVRRRGPSPISKIADDGVRQIGMFGLPKSGREFDLPYKKSLHITRVPFTSAFAQAFVDLVDQVQQARGLKVVVQAVVGGAAFARNGAATTHMQRRDALVQLVFDVFYEDGKEAAAWAFQAKMRNLLKGYSGGEDIRMMWGTFEEQNANGAQLDMSRPATQKLYYDSPAAYARLQKIKASADPRNIFRTSFTVTP